MHPNRSYLICATPRSGSTLLCEFLINTGIAGNPKEYFEALKESGLPRRPREYFTSLDNLEVSELLGSFSRLDATSPAFQNSPNYADYLSQVRQEATTPNGVLGAKVMWNYLDDFISNLRDIPAYRDLAVPTLLSTIFPDLHYIWVTRQDKVRQAISLWKAIQTWTWREDEISSSPHQHGHTHQDLCFHFEAIDHLVQQIEADEQEWLRYFVQSSIHPYRIVYEDLVENYQTIIPSILRYLQIPVPEHLTFTTTQMKRQSNNLSEEWVERYYCHKNLVSNPS